MQTVKTPGFLSRLVCRYPTGYAWPANDDRIGRYVMCPTKPEEPMGLGVVDDFGDLVAVPSHPVGICTVIPASGVWPQ